MIKYTDLTGQTFSRLTVLKISDRRGKKNEIYWNVICICGKQKNVEGSSLKKGTAQSCGCLTIDSATKHGMEGSKIYRVWDRIKQSCTNPHRKEWNDYGGRGITLCQEWHKFIPFKDWAFANEYKEGLTIDRIDNDKGYSPDNCRFITMRENTQNRRSTILNAEIVKSIRSSNLKRIELAKLYGCSLSMIHAILQNRTWQDIM